MSKRSPFQQQYFKFSVRPNALIVIIYVPSMIISLEKLHGELQASIISWADGMGRFTVDFNNNVIWMAMQLSKSAIASMQCVQKEELRRKAKGKRAAANLTA